MRVMEKIRLHECMIWKLSSRWAFIVEFSECGDISGHILMNLLRHLNYLKLFDNDRENVIIPVLLVDGHVSSFYLFFWDIYVIKITNGKLFFVFCM